MVNQRDYMLKKIKRIEDQLVRLKRRNDEKEMSILMHQIYDDGKSLSDFEPSELRRLLCYVEEKIKNIREKIGHLEEVLPPNPPPPLMSCLLQNETDSRINIDGQVSDQKPFLDLVKVVDQVNGGQGNFGGFNGTFDLGVFPPGNFGGLIGGNDPGSGVFPSDKFGGLLGKIDSGLGVLPLGNFGGHIGDSKSGLGVLPPSNFGGLNCESGHLGSGVLPQGNFGGLSGESNHSGLLPQGNFIGLNGESNSGLLYGSHAAEIGGSGIWQPYGYFGSSIGGSEMTLPYSSSTSNINGTYMGIDQQHNENKGGSIDNIGLCCHQNNFGANTNGADMGRSNANYVDTNYGKNLNPGLPSHGNFASTSSGEGCGIEVPKSLAGNFP